jgi:GNAT superfamily N-acetyltransferase
MRQVNRLLRAATIDVRVGDPHHPDFVLCLDAYHAELAERCGGFDPTISRPLAPEQLIAPGGLLVMAHHRKHPIGCGAITFGEDRIGAIKRMWVSRDFRGLGVGSRILDEIERRARDHGIRTLRLENRRELYEATEMYRQFNYRVTDPFNDEFYADRWYEKSLASDDVGRIGTEIKHPVAKRYYGAPPTQC